MLGISNLSLTTNLLWAAQFRIDRDRLNFLTVYPRAFPRNFDLGLVTPRRPALTVYE
jgi:hypothetical protein